MEMESAVARERFRLRIARLVAVSILVDLLGGVGAYFAEKGAAHAFGTLWDAWFWTTTQLLTISSQLPNPERPVTKVLDVVLELYAVVVITSLAATFTDALHHRTRRKVHERTMEAA